MNLSKKGKAFRAIVHFPVGVLSYFCGRCTLNCFWQLIQRLYLGKFGDIPSPPEKLGEIKAEELYFILQTAYPQARHIYLGDSSYQLTSIDEWRRFLEWDMTKYDTYHYGARDCEDFSWKLKASAVDWMNGEFAFGWIVGFNNENPTIPTHGFNILIDHEKKLWFADPLGLVVDPCDACEAFPLSYVEDIIF